MEDIIRKAETLVDALPYIRNFSGKTFVVKYGGAAQTRDDLKESFAKDIVMMNYIGIRTVIVHGGGPKISAMMERLGKRPEFVHGQRVTDQETMDIVEMVLGGLINKEIVSLINRNGGRAVGLSGKDGGLICAQKKLIKKVTAETGVSEIIDLGLVGEVTQIAPAVIDSLDAEGFIPVIAPIGVGTHGEALNINADFVAAAVASALKAEKLILLTDVAGLLDKKGRIISTLKKGQVPKLMKDGTISGGMIPKVQACLSSIDAGVGKTHIIDGRIPHCLLLEIFTKEGIGTEIMGA
ncbi:MAG: acetylglutamate kinase [Thermodesulfovibrionales bacterium]